jgi:hypothetical protein
LLTKLIEEVNNKFLADLAPLAREDPGSSEGYDSDDGEIITNHAAVHKNTRFIVIGGSHAARIDGALDDLDLEVADLSSPGWTVTEANVQCATALLLEELKQNKQMKTIIIYQLLDNSSYFGTGEDGQRRPPLKDQGRYHIISDLQLADRDLVKLMVNTCTPLLRAGGDHEKIITVPFMRYMSYKCCEDPNHLTNFKCKGWGNYIGESLININTWLNDVVYLKRIRNFEIMCPNELLQRNVSLKKAAWRLYKFWSQDPVHMTKEGYAELAVALSVAACDLTLRRPCPGGNTPQQCAGTGIGRGSGSGTGTGRGSGTGTGPQRASSLASVRRQSWVSADDAIAERHQQRGGLRGGRGRPWHTPATRGSGGWRGSGQRSRGRRLRPY